MKLNLLSDLHLSFSPMDCPATDADLVVLAGDIARPRQAVEWALQLDKPALYVPGNHEFYGGSIDGTLDQLRRLCEGTPVRLLERDEVVIDGVRFLGAILWTDFELFSDAERRAASKAEAQRLMYDFQRVRTRQASSEIFTPDDAARLFHRDAAWLDERLNRAHAGPTVVITHHAPALPSIHPRFADSLLNAAFASDAARLMGAARAALWIHGHMHNGSDYCIDGTRVLCNPRGYGRDGVNENPEFDPGFMIEIDRGGKVTTRHADGWQAQPQPT
jgi:Icc-related predicted phosphoesterase